jgi:hypothetical protein
LFPLLAAQPAIAGMRLIDAPAASTWLHAASGVVMPASIGGWQRVSLGDRSARQQDVIASYESDHGAASIYLFRPGAGDVSLWFDRIRATVEQQGFFGAVEAAQPVSFAPDGKGSASALRVDYRVDGDATRRAALVAIPAGEWIVAIRMSAKADTPLDADLNSLVAGLRFRSSTANAAAYPIADCATRLSFGRARQLDADMDAAMAGATIDRKSVV